MIKHFMLIVTTLLSLCSDALAQNKPTTAKAGKNEFIKHTNVSLPIVEPHLAVNPHNSHHMVATAIVFDSAAPTVSGDHIVVFATKDNWKTWKQTDLEMTHGGDPWVAIKNDKDVVLIALAGFANSQNNGLIYYTSGDGGFTWSKEPVKLGGGHDHPTLTTDPKGRLYILSSLIKKNAAKESMSYAYLNYSDDWKTFQDTAALYTIGKTNSNTLTAATQPDGTVVLPYVEYVVENDIPGNPSIKYIHTKDGKQFSQPVLITNKTGLRKGFAVLAIDGQGKYKGRMYFVKNTGTEPHRSKGLFLQYADHINGPWYGDIRIDHAEKEEKFIRTAAIAVNREGIVGIAWVDRRSDPELKKNDIYFTVSPNGGKSFEKEIRVSDISSDPLTPGNGKTGERFISGGDYIGCIAKPDGSFQVLWSDSRSGVFQLYTCNISLK